MVSLRAVLGQPLALELLGSALREGRLAGAYLFVGPDGIGKRTTAEALVRVVLCSGAHAADLTACGHCAACAKTSAASHTDRVEIRRPEDKKEISVGAIRELARRLAFSPHEGGRRVVLIPDAHELSSSASNALLKTLEEPPDRTHFILMTSALHALLPTIRSRCQVVRFVPLRTDDLISICLQHGASDLEADAAAALAGGSAAAALTALGQGGLDAERARAEAFADAAASGSLAAALAAAGEASADKGGSLRRTLELLQVLYRDVLLAHEGLSAEHLEQRDRLSLVRTLSGALSARAVLDRLAALREGTDRLDRNANATLVAEWIALRFQEAR